MAKSTRPKFGSLVLKMNRWALSILQMLCDSRKKLKSIWLKSRLKPFLLFAV